MLHDLDVESVSQTAVVRSSESALKQPGINTSWGS
jgi:hypothetical protein